MANTNTMYIGEKVNGIAHGQGTLIYPSGGVYKGQFANGKPHGNGMYISEDNSVIFKGTFIDGHIHGEVHLIENGILTYICQYNFGKEISRTESIVKKNERELETALKQLKDLSAKEASLTKQLQEQKLKNQGLTQLQTKQPQTSYVPSSVPSQAPRAERFVDVKLIKGNIENGVGFYRLLNGEEFNGEFVDGLKHGKGVYTFPNGYRYTGTWKNDKKDGKGVWTHLKENTEINVEYVDGQLNGKFHYSHYSSHYEDQVVYSGEYAFGDILRAFYFDDGDRQWKKDSFTLGFLPRESVDLRFNKLKTKENNNGYYR